LYVSNNCQLETERIVCALIYKQLYLPLLADYALSTIKEVFAVFKKALSLAASLELIANDPLKHVTPLLIMKY